MTANKDSLYSYFKDKFREWKRADGSIERHVPWPGGKEKIIAELKRDAAHLKSEVCPYLKEAGYIQSKNVLIEAAEDAAGKLAHFPVTGAFDVTLGALIFVCGYRRQGLDLIVEGI